MRRLAIFSFAFAAAMLGAVLLLPPAARLPLAALCALLALVPERRVAIACLGLAAALAWLPLYDALVRAPARALEEQTVILTGEVTDYPVPTKRGLRVTVAVSPFARALLYLEEGDPQLGDKLTATVYLRPSDRVGGEETETYTSKGIFLIGYVRGAVTLERPESLPVRHWPRLWGQLLRQRLAQAYPPGAGGLVSAVLTGEKSGLDDTDYTALKRTGLAHAVAVSGLHVHFLMELLGTLLGRYRRRTAALALPVLLVFVLMTGCSPSVVRAALMQGLLLLAPLLGREGDGPTNLGLALLLLLVQNPYAAASVSLQLSFLSVAGMLAFSQPMYQRAWAALKWKNPATKLLLASLTTTLGALSLTTPVLAYYFGLVSLIAPLANLLCLWAVGLIFIGGLVGALAGLPVGALLCRYVLGTARLLGGLPFAAVSLSSVFLLLWGVFAYAVVVFCMVKRPRPVVPGCCCALTLCAALLLTRLDYRAGQLVLTALDVGQGQSVLLRAGDRVAMVDCGGSGGRNAGDLAADYLADRGIRTVDLLVLTHFHADHADGVLELLERTAVSVLAVPAEGEPSPLGAEILAAAAEKEIQLVTVDEDLSLILGPALLTLYAPLGAGETNEAGLSVLCQSGEFSALFTGDMDQSIEKRLVKYGALPDVDLLMAGHHGARGSTSALLLETVTPELVLISVGYNSYGHPSLETLDRVAETGGAIYRTDVHGNITVKLRRKRHAAQVIG